MYQSKVSLSLTFIWRTFADKIIENKRQFEVEKLDYPCRNLII